MMGEKRTESLLALAVSGVLVFSLTPSPLLRFGVSRLPALHRDLIESHREQHNNLYRIPSSVCSSNRRKKNYTFLFGNVFFGAGVESF
jgi:hypothetical protein